MCLAGSWCLTVFAKPAPAGFEKLIARIKERLARAAVLRYRQRPSLR